MFERFSPEARRVLFLSKFHAAAAGASHIEPEHLLAGVLRERDRLTLEILQNLHLNAAQLEHDCGVTGPLPKQPVGDPPLSGVARKIVASAGTVADDTGSSTVAPYCLLLAIMRDRASAGAKLLAQHGAHYETAVEVAARLRADRPDRS